MSYKAMYIPTSDQIWVDGCKYIDKNGEVFEYNPGVNLYTNNFKENHRVAELMIVDMQFNQTVIVGRPSPDAKWLKNGMDIKPSDVLLLNKGEDGISMYNIRCFTCRELH